MLSRFAVGVWWLGTLSIAAGVTVGASQVSASFNGVNLSLEIVTNPILRSAR